MAMPAGSAGRSAVSEDIAELRQHVLFQLQARIDAAESNNRDRMEIKLAFARSIVRVLAAEDVEEQAE